jgi:hypothetical protein
MNVISKFKDIDHTANGRALFNSSIGPKEEVKALYKTGFFDQVSASIVQSSNAPVLRYSLTEKPLIRKIFIKGNSEVSEDSLTPPPWIKRSIGTREPSEWSGVCRTIRLAPRLSPRCHGRSWEQ